MNRILTDAELKGLLEEPIETSHDPKDIFIDEVNPYKYIELDSNAVTFDRINLVLHKNLKMSLIYGSPGTGKSMFLSRLHNNLSVQSKYSILIVSPILDDFHLFRTISFEIFKDSSLQDIPSNFNSLIIALEENEDYLLRTRPILLLDEAQLYSDSTLEKIRILADTQKIRVIFAVHQLKEKNIFTQEHFKSRIWERIELRNATLNELRVYIQKKLMSGSMLELANQFSKRIVKIIFKITKGNYRVTNNLLYAYLNNYPQLYKPQFNSKPLKIRKREIEITAIQIKFIKVSDNIIDIQHLPTAELEWQNIQKKEYLKMFVIFIIPIFIYLIFKIISYKDSEIIINRQLSIQDIQTGNKIEENLSFQMPIANEIIEEEIEDNELFVNEINTSIKEIVEKVVKTKDINQTVVQEEVINKIQKNIVKKEVQDEILKQVQNNTVLKETKEEVVNKVQKEIQEINKIIKKAPKKPKNIFLENIKINPILFKNPIQVYPDLTFLDNFQEYIPSNIEDHYILSLKSEFKINQTIPILLKILNYYQRVKNYEQVYNYSIILNITDLNSTKPYLNLIEILELKGEIQYIEKIKEGCKNCEF